MQFVTTDLIGGLGNQLFQIANTLEIFHQLNQKYPGKYKIIFNKSLGNENLFKYFPWELCDEYPISDTEKVHIYNEDPDVFKLISDLPVPEKHLGHDHPKPGAARLDSGDVVQSVRNRILAVCAVCRHDAASRDYRMGRRLDASSGSAGMLPGRRTGSCRDGSRDRLILTSATMYPSTDCGKFLRRSRFQGLQRPS